MFAYLLCAINKDKKLLKPNSWAPCLGSIHRQDILQGFKAATDKGSLRSYAYVHLPRKKPRIRRSETHPSLYQLFPFPPHSF